MEIKTFEQSIDMTTEMLSIVRSLSCLKHFTWICDFAEIGTDIGDTKYELVSDSLEYVDFSRTGKYFHLWDIRCPHLREFKYESDAYGCVYEGRRLRYCLFPLYVERIISEKVVLEPLILMEELELFDEDCTLYGFYISLISNASAWSIVINCNKIKLPLCTAQINTYRGIFS
jgi:hypothetical protein